LLPQFVFSQNETELMKGVKYKLNKVNDYQADGLMKIDVSFIKAPPSIVKVYYKRPDKFNVKKDGGISILPKGSVSVNLNSIISGDNYTIVPAGNAVLENSTVKVIKLLPNDENSDVVVTSLYIDEKKLLVRKSIITTKESGTYEIEMVYGKYSEWGLPDRVLFVFNTKDYKLPKGMTFEYESGEKKPKTTTLENKKGKIEITYSNYVINKGIPDSFFK
jgi:outer membrane lipoprotein-sorting protein